MAVHAVTFWRVENSQLSQHTSWKLEGYFPHREFGKLGRGNLAHVRMLVITYWTDREQGQPTDTS